MDCFIIMKLDVTLKDSFSFRRIDLRHNKNGVTVAAEVTSSGYGAKYFADKSRATSTRHLRGIFYGGVFAPIQPNKARDGSTLDVHFIKKISNHRLLRHLQVTCLLCVRTICCVTEVPIKLENCRPICSIFL